MVFKKGKHFTNFMIKRYWNRTGRFFICVTLLSLFGLVMSLISFRSGVEEVHRQHLQASIENTAQTSLMYANHLINEMVASLDEAAKAVNAYDDFQHPDVLSILKYTKNTSKFGFVGVADAEGNGYDNDGNIVSIADREYFQNAMKGQVSFSEVMPSKVFPDETVQIVAHPIRAGENTVRGVIFGALHINDIEQLGIQNEVNRQDNIFIVDSCGAYIAQFYNHHTGTSSNNLWNDLKNSSLSNEELSQIKSDFEERKEGSISYFYGDDERYACYMPLGPNKWQLLYSVSTSSMDNLVHELYWLNTKETISAGICYVILLACIIWYFKRANDETRKAHQEADRNLEYMRIAIDHSKHIVFEYNQTNQIIRLKTSARNQLFDHSVIMHVPETLMSKNVIAPDSVSVFERLFETIKTVKSATADIHLLGENEETWYRISMNNIYNNRNRIMDTVGIVEDISVQKKHEFEMKKRFQVQKTLISNALMYGVIDLNAATILEWNEETVCLPYEETIRKKILETVSGEHISYVEQNLSLESLRNEYRQGKDSVEVQFLRKFDNELRWVSIVIYRMYMDDTAKVLFVLTDIDNQKRRALLLKEQAERDGLTGLYNAVTTRAKIDEALSLNQQRNENQIFVLIDLDNYKQINDTFGHIYGDHVLADVANILNNRFRSSDIVGRIGGDEFVILLRDIKSYDYAERLIEDLCKSIYRTYREGDQEVTISASIGIAVAPKDGNSFKELYQKSDIAQYQVKKQNKNGFKRYE